MKFPYSKFSILFLLLVITTIGAADPATVQLLSLGRMNEAISALSNRGDPESFNLLSRAYYAMERWDDAVKWGERAIAERPQDAGYRLWLARAYGRKAGDSNPCLLYTSDAADEEDSVDLGGGRIIKKKK